MKFNPPPNWPEPPAGWTPPAGWAPDPTWGPPPLGWQLWIKGDNHHQRPTGSRRSGRLLLILGGLVVVVVVLIAVGIHVLAPHANEPPDSPGGTSAPYDATATKAGSGSGAAIELNGRQLNIDIPAQCLTGTDLDNKPLPGSLVIQPDPQAFLEAEKSLYPNESLLSAAGKMDNYRFSLSPDGSVYEMVITDKGKSITGGQGASWSASGNSYTISGHVAATPTSSGAIPFDWKAQVTCP